MQIQEQSNYTKFKWVGPFCHGIGLITVTCGPYLFPIIFWKLVFCLGLYGFVRLTYMLVCGLIVLYKAYNTKNVLPGQYPTDYHYAWVIPNYMESMEVIIHTLQQLATHPRSKQNYIICLAMEEHEVGSGEKAKVLCEKFKTSFKHITATIHKIVKNQAKGKASNVSYAVEKMEEILPKWVNFDNLMITIMDCDSIAPKEYIDQVNKYLYQEPSEKDNCVFNPTQIFKRNDLDVSVIIRSFDHYHSFAHSNNLISYFEFGSPFSNYTFSYNLIKEVGFWDKNAEALAEDMHTLSKLIWRTDGRARSIPIYTSFNQLNLEQPDSNWSNIKGKWNQVLRHAYGIHEVSYNMYEFANCKKKTLRGWCFILYFIDIMLVSNCIGIPMILTFQVFTLFGSTNPYFLAHSATLDFLLKVCLVLNALVLLTYDVFKRYTNKRYYKKENESYWRFFEIFVFLTIGIHFFIYPTFLIASVVGFYKNIEYKTSEKRINSKEQKEQ